MSFCNQGGNVIMEISFSMFSLRQLSIQECFVLTVQIHHVNKTLKVNYSSKCAFCSHIPPRSCCYTNPIKLQAAPNNSLIIRVNKVTSGQGKSTSSLNCAGENQARLTCCTQDHFHRHCYQVARTVNRWKVCRLHRYLCLQGLLNLIQDMSLPDLDSRGTSTDQISLQLCLQLV